MSIYSEKLDDSVNTVHLKVVIHVTHAFHCSTVVLVVYFGRPSIFFALLQFILSIVENRDIMTDTLGETTT